MAEQHWSKTFLFLAIAFVLLSPFICCGTISMLGLTGRAYLESEEVEKLKVKHDHKQVEDWVREGLVDDTPQARKTALDELRRLRAK